MKYNKIQIMKKAWEIYRKFQKSKKNQITFGEALHRAWNSVKARPINDRKIADAKKAAGITEEVNTWTGWRDHGFEVIHGSKALFSVDLIYASKGDDATYKASFFGWSQICHLDGNIEKVA